MLAERGLAADQVAGSGEGGRITVEDVLAAEAASEAAAAAAAPRSPAPQRRKACRVPTRSPMRRRIAAHMVESLPRTAPHVTNVFECDMTAVARRSRERKPDSSAAGTALTLTAYFVAASRGRNPRECRRQMGAGRMTPSCLHDRIDMGIRDGAPGIAGWSVPVIRDAGSLDLAGIAGALSNLS